MASQQNPFDRGYAAIVAAIQAWPALSALVKPGNFQNLQAPGYRPRTNVQSGDRVELKLLEGRFNMRPFSVNSIAADFICTYPLQIASGYFGVSKINLVLWECGRALTNAGPQLTIADILLKWDLIGEGSFRQMDTVAARSEWTTIANIRLEFKLERSAYLLATYT